MTDKSTSKRRRSVKQATCLGHRDPSVTVALITGIATVMAAIITAIAGPILTRQTPSTPKPQSSPSPSNSWDKVPNRVINRTN